MNTMVKSFGLLMILILTVLIQSAITSNSSHNQELNRIVDQAMNATQRVASDKRYSIASNDEYIAEFMQNLYRSTISKSDYKIAIYGIDYEKGFLDVGVTQIFKQVTGKQKEKTVRKTSILEKANGGEN